MASAEEQSEAPSRRLRGSESDDDDEWAFDCQPLNLLFGEPPSFHGDPQSPYVYRWPAESPLAGRAPVEALLPDSSVELMAHHIWEVCLISWRALPMVPPSQL